MPDKNWPASVEKNVEYFSGLDEEFQNFPLAKS
jgi:hypothetical protein